MNDSTRERDEPKLERNDSAGAEAKTATTRRKVIAWAWVVAWALVIWTFGGDSFSLTETNDMIIPWLDWLTGDLDYRTRYRIYVGIRKSAHFIEYAILAGLTFRASLIAASRNQIATAGWVALFIVMTLASADEARQAFSDVRTGSPYDVLIDVAGGVVMVLGLLVISKRLRPSNTVESSA